MVLADDTYAFKHELFSWFLFVANLALLFEIFLGCVMVKIKYLQPVEFEEIEEQNHTVSTIETPPPQKIEFKPIDFKEIEVKEVSFSSLFTIIVALGTTGCFDRLVSRLRFNNVIMNELISILRVFKIVSKERFKERFDKFCEICKINQLPNILDLDVVFTYFLNQHSDNADYLPYFYKYKILNEYFHSILLQPFNEKLRLEQILESHHIKRGEKIFTLKDIKYYPDLLIILIHKKFFKANQVDFPKRFNMNVFTKLKKPCSNYQLCSFIIENNSVLVNGFTTTFLRDDCYQRTNDWHIEGLIDKTHDRFVTKQTCAILYKLV